MKTTEPKKRGNNKETARMREKAERRVVVKEREEERGKKDRNLKGKLANIEKKRVNFFRIERIIIREIEEEMKKN